MADSLLLVSPRSKVDDLLLAARSRLHRLSPLQAWDEWQAGALLVDIRSELHRRIEGEIPGSLVLERNVLEWRLDPGSDARIAEAAADRRVIVVCNAGFTSSLAAAALLDVGVWATDLDGGFRGWRAVGLPTVSGATPAGRRVPAGGSSPVPCEAQRPLTPASLLRALAAGVDSALALHSGAVRNAAIAAAPCIGEAAGRRCPSGPAQRP
ncbi:MAG: rhodanese-like domain-containing protein [Frankiaceae bacterium]